ncbi:MAG: hypothetical protein C4335_01670 [Armatimonadota bacterium]
MVTMNSVITLLTDFGTQDTYVGVMKGVIASICPQAVVIDLTHEVPPQDVMTGAFLLDVSVDYFPPRTVHVAVVDPGVGTQRKPLAIQTDRAVFVGPDNGIFTLVLQRYRAIMAVQLDNSKYHLPEKSATFHGRDIFAPVAAHLANGVGLEELGTPVTHLNRLRLPRVRVDWQGIRATVVHLDRFGNAITNLTYADYEKWRIRWEVREPVVRLAKAGVFLPVCRTYGDVPDGQPLALFGSSGRLEVAVNKGSAARAFNLRRGDVVWVLRQESGLPPRVQRSLNLAP